MKKVRKRLLSTASGLVVLAAVISNPVYAQETAKPKEMPEASVVSEMQAIKEGDLWGLSQPFIVQGETNFNGWFVKTDKIVFKSGGKLIFTKQAQDARRQFFLIAKEIVSEDQNSPGMVSYVASESLGVDAATGQASTGPHAVNDDQPGQPGTTGTKGPTGTPGYSAPSLTIVTLSIPGSGPMIDFSGHKGGPGGTGQKGGDGGNGAKGHPASSSLFDCKNGAGDGGSGGKGGTGGPGGVGGTGGNGGAVTIIAPAELLPSMTQKFRVMVSAGGGGNPGGGGDGGNGGLGGPRGAKSLPYCKDDGKEGARGDVGAKGPGGETGKQGVDGDFFVGAISPQNFAKVYD